MTTPSPRPQRHIVRAFVLTLVALALAGAATLLLLALIEAITPVKPLTYLFVTANKLGDVRQNMVELEETSALAPTFTPTPIPPTPIPPTPTPLPPTPTPTDSPTPSPSPTPHPPTDTPTFTPTPTDTTTPTTTPTDTPTVTPTPNAAATTKAQATAAIVARATARAAATATAKAPKPTLAPTRVPPPPPPGRLSGRIAFPVFDGRRGMFDIYIANIDGSDMRPLITEASQPSLNPRNAQIVYRRWTADQRGLATMNLDNGDSQRRTTYLEDGAPAWSFDGGRFVFFTRREADRQPRIAVFDIYGGGEQMLHRDFSAAYGEMPSWLSDGRIVYKATAPESGIGAMNADGSNFRMIVPDGSATAPTASPDGRFIAFMSLRDGNWEIYRANVDGSGLVRLTQHGANDGLPVWAPDGRAIAFASNRSGAWAIWAMNVDGSNQRQLFALPGPLDARLPREPDFVHHGWVEERISWRP